MSRIAVALICLCALAGCGGDVVPTAAPPSAPMPTPPPTPPPAPEPPEAPAGFRVSATGVDFLEWSWNAVSAVSGYQVQYSFSEAFTNADEVIDRTADQTSYRREDLAVDTTAYLRVRPPEGRAKRGSIAPGPPT